jgi:S1-C subfamily serine protease
MAFRFDDPGRKFAIKVMKRHAIIDLAVLGIETTSGRLAKGNPSSMNAMDHLLVVGHPNYRIGDSPMSVPGLIVGFRTKSGIRRIITNAPIVAGASGGPVLNAFGDVIGIAVTGSDKFATSAETEDQSIIPSDAIDLL